MPSLFALRIQAGLAPPFAGEHCYRHVKEHVDEVVLVSDAELRKAMRLLFDECSVGKATAASSNNESAPFV